MVGVAGKSKACNDCKRRRVKCGLERPQCTRCVRARIQCSGYNQETLFVNNTLANPFVSTTSVVSADVKRRAVLHTIQDELSGLIRLSDEPVGSPSYFRLQAFQLLQKLYLPTLKTVDNHPGHVTPMSWFRAVCELDQPCAVLDRALIAFCTAQVYVTKAGNTTHDEAVDRYNATLGYLSTALSQEPRPDYILASIVVLSTCEFFICSTDDGLRIHIQGIADILRLKKGLREVSSTIWASLCSRLRVISVLSQLTCRRRGSASAEQWYELMQDNPSPDLLDLLIEIVYELPETLHMGRKALETGQAYGHEHDRAMKSLWSTLKGILDWHAGLRLWLANTGPLYTTVTSKLNNPSDESHVEKLFPFALEFNSLQIATYCVLSWSCQLHIHMILLKLLEVYGKTSTVPPEFFTLYQSFGSIRCEAHRLARYLCQSIEYCHRLEMGTFGPQSMIYPQWILRHFYTYCGVERELRWCENVERMTGPESRCDIKLMKFQGLVF